MLERGFTKGCVASLATPNDAAPVLHVKGMAVVIAMQCLNGEAGPI